MNNAFRYDQDFYGWAVEQATLLRNGRLSEADLENIAEELDGLGRSEKRALVSRLEVLLSHLLKWQAQPAFRSRSWQLTIKEQRRKLDRLLKENPSFRPLLDDAILDAYGDALLAVQRETGLPGSDFPTDCPFTKDQIRDAEFTPGGV